MESIFLISSSVIAEYLIITAIILMSINFGVTLFTLILRNDVLYNDTGSHFIANVVLLAFEILFTIFSIIVFSSEELFIALSLPIICGRLKN